MISAKIWKTLLVSAGSVSFILGVVGIFVPLLPTTPFLLLAAICYAKSSKKLYSRLLSSKVAGSYIKSYLEGSGIPLRAKIISIALVSVTIGYHVIFLESSIWLKAALLAVAFAVSFYIASIKGKPKEKAVKEDAV